MRSLLLMRHAEAERGSGVPDMERPITKEGRDDALRMGEVLRAHDLVPDVIVASPARRAQQSAASVARSSQAAVEVRTSAMMYGAGSNAIIETLQGLPHDTARVLVVGHDPDISRFVERLTGVRTSLPPGGLAAIDVEIDTWSKLDDGSARTSLIHLWRPRRASPEEPSRTRRKGRTANSKWFVASADERVVDAARRAMEQKLEYLLDRLVAIADASIEDRDLVRKLRVATRRAEAVLRAFRDVLPRHANSRVRVHLRAIRKATNAARDDDVLLSRVETSATPALIAAVQADRRAAQREVLALCRRLAGDAELARSMAVLRRKAMVSSRENDAGVARFDAWARTRMARSIERFFAGEPTDLGDVECLHDLRLRTKKLRYEIEILAAVLPMRLQAEIHPILSELQDRLGDVNDCAVALRRLRRFARSASSLRMAPLDSLVSDAAAALVQAQAALGTWWTPERAARVQRAMTELG